MTRDDLASNAFFVLGLTPAATRAEVERAGQKLLAQLAIGAASARSYATPLGPMPRTEELVRTALAVLRDPERRVELELWAEAAAPARAQPAPAFVEAFSAIGWKRSS